MSRRRIYKAKHYLACYEAVEYLEYLAGSKINNHDLLSLVRSEGLKCHVFIDDLLPSYVDSLKSVYVVNKEYKLWKYAVITSGLSAVQINNECWGGLISAFPDTYNPLVILAIYSDDDFSGGEFYDLDIYKTQPVHPADIRPLGREEYGLNLYFLSDDIQNLAKLINDTEEPKDEAVQQHEQPKQIYKGMQQEGLILSTLKELGYNPKNLPKPSSAGGAKAQVKKLLDKKPPFEAKTAFNNAWKGLTSNEEIKTG